MKPKSFTWYVARYAWAFYIGWAATAVGLHVWQWQYHAFVIPLIALVQLQNETHKTK